MKLFTLGLVFLFVGLSHTGNSFCLSRITGQVVSSRDGKALPQVLIVEKETKLSAKTTASGHFEIWVRHPQPVVEISAPGFKTRVQKISGQNLRLKLDPASK